MKGPEEIRLRSDLAELSVIQTRLEKMLHRHQGLSTQTSLLNAIGHVNNVGHDLDGQLSALLAKEPN